MIHFSCTCGNALFFENSLCLKCGSTVGYDLAQNAMRPVSAEQVLCRNGSEFSVCNWLVPAGGPKYCTSCDMNHMVPDLSVAGNQDSWRKMEIAKRRAIYTLSQLHIVPASRKQNPDGLAFDFLTPVPTHCVMTGHDNGIITLNLNEADNLYREKQRHSLGEPYRTLVGHFRHELGHYYWDRFFSRRAQDDRLLAEFRTLFGDERADYNEALSRYYANGPGMTWSTTHISAYATSHPWEDWAETWAQYLHIVDGVETAASFCWSGRSVPIPFTPLKPEQVLADSPDKDASFLTTLNDWARLSPALNEMAASLGYTTLYPFIFSPQTARKILFVHRMVKIASQSWAQQMTGSSQPPISMPAQQAVANPTSSGTPPAQSVQNAAAA